MDADVVFAAMRLGIRQARGHSVIPFLIFQIATAVVTKQRHGC
jgi:hypothetical protein